jgi:hypothetical protein
MIARVKLRVTGESVTLIDNNLAQIIGEKILEAWNTWE